MIRKHIISFLRSAKTLYKSIRGIKSSEYHIHLKSQKPNKKPRIIQPVVKISLYTSKQIDEKIREQPISCKDMYALNKKLIQKSNTDLIILQGICDVCSPIERDAKKTTMIY